MDDIDSIDARILDVNAKDIETSIWFDSFDNIMDFTKDEIFDDAICFLLAKDVNFQLIEDKEEKRIKNLSSVIKQKPKTPSHCIYIKSENILLMEESSSSPSISTLNRGILSKINSLKKDDIKFRAKTRENIIERLNEFVENIKSIELIDINMEKYLNQKEDDGYLYNFLHNPETKLNAKLYLESNNLKTNAVNFFRNVLNNRATKELNNIKILFKDNKQNSDIITLHENLVYLKLEKDVYWNDISILENLERISYSKNIYKTIIETYYEQKTSF